MVKEPGPPPELSLFLGVTLLVFVACIFFGCFIDDGCAKGVIEAVRVKQFLKDLFSLFVNVSGLSAIIEHGLR